MSLIELRNVSMGYGVSARRVDVLADVNLQVREGEFLAIVGFSGAGKTTLISLLAGLLTPDAGSVMVGGQPVRGPGPDRGVVFQNYSLLPWLSAYDNVRLAVDQVHASWPREKRAQWIESCLATVNLLPARDKRPAQLSGGMRQRVALARALAMDPKVLLFDEPLSALDALTRASLQREIARLHAQDRKTVILVTNDVDEGILLADRIVPMTAGPRATLGAPIVVDLPRPRSQTALNRDPAFKRIRSTVIEFLLDSAGRGGRRHDGAAAGAGAGAGVTITGETGEFDVTAVEMSA